MEQRKPQAKRTGFLYDSSAGPLATICKCGYSVVPIVLSRVDYWIFFGFHLSVFLCYNQGVWPSADTELGQYMNLGTNEVKVITALTTFFEVFYTNQCFTRYMELYKLTCTLLLTAQQLAIELRFVLHDTSAKHARLVLRYFLAALVVHLDEEIQPGIAEAIGGKAKLLTAEEQAYIGEFQSGQGLVVMQMASSVFLLKANEVSLHAGKQKSILNKVEQAHKAMAKLSDTLNLPVPFQYYHLLCFMVVICVLSWGFFMGASAGVGGIFVFLVAELIFMGMIQLATDLSDPFGNDAVDFPLKDWVAECLDTCGVIMEYEQDCQSDEQWEAKLARETQLDLGIELDDGSGRWLPGWNGEHCDYMGCGPAVACSIEDSDGSA
mmetsp:Transcript_47606/g.136945  ORF Transcript_47606/g.136945 Transcript_47606/m.136945 type:complete len:379 (-) Transcript_47606:69-1205(-)